MTSSRELEILQKKPGFGNLLLVNNAKPYPFNSKSNRKKSGKSPCRFKEYTSKQIQALIKNNTEESRREWMTWMFERAGSKSSNVKNGHFWQHNNKPIELWSNEAIDQKVDYIHNNQVVAGFVNEPEHWRYSSAIDYRVGKGILEIDFV